MTALPPKRSSSLANRENVPWANGRDSLRPLTNRNSLRIASDAKEGNASYVRQIELENENMKAQVERLRASEATLRQQLSDAAHLEQAMCITAKQAQNEVHDLEAELSILRDALATDPVTDESREFYEAEQRSLKTALKKFEEEAASLRAKLNEKDVEIVSLSQQRTELMAERDDLENSKAALEVELDEALKREKYREEKSEHLLVAQPRAGLEAWKAEMESTRTITPFQSRSSLDQACNTQDFRSFDDSILHDFDIVEVLRDLDSAVTPSQASNTPPRRGRRIKKLKRIFTHRRKKNRPTAEAMKTFAIKELEDEIDELTRNLLALVDDFATTNVYELLKLQRLQNQITDCMNCVRIVSVKLYAVREMV